MSEFQMHDANSLTTENKALQNSSIGTAFGTEDAEYPDPAIAYASLAVPFVTAG